MAEKVNANPKKVFSDFEAMALAISVAKQGAGFVSPNPLVGCVILNPANEVLASGAHLVYGGPHAEVNALKDLSPAQLQGARVFVTLEPCAHYGKTPPCADKLASLPIAEVIYGLKDPNPLVAGRGAQKIKDAGIKVNLFSDLYPLHYELQLELEELCEVFLWNQRHKQPFVSLKVGTSLDGMIGLKSGESKWITGSTSRNHAHFLRATHDVILIGVNTLLTDNPSLDIRHDNFKNKTNSVFIIDPHGRGLPFLKESAILKTHPADFTFVFVQEGFSKNNKLDSYPFRIVECPIFEKQNVDDTHRELGSMENILNTLDLQFIINEAWQSGFKSILVEGGAKTLSSFIKQKKANRLYQFIAPCLVGANNGTNWTTGLEIGTLNEKITLKNMKMHPMDKDILLTASFNNEIEHLS